jgi:hypothetical protein
MKKKLLRAIVETGFIIFLFYSNLLMGEFTNNGIGNKRGLIWALGDIFTLPNFFIAALASFIAYIMFEYFRKKYL